MKCENCECCVKGFVHSKPDTYFCIGCKEPYKVYPEQECNNSSKLSSQDERPDFFGPNFFDELFNDSTFNEQMDLLKDSFADSVKDDVKKIISDLQKKNTELTNEIEKLKAENVQLKEENENLSETNDFGSYLASFINKDNVYKIIECIFDKSFDEDSKKYEPYWATYVNYYNDRKDIIKLLKYVGECPDWLENVVLPHEWDEQALDKFFDCIDDDGLNLVERDEYYLTHWDYERSKSIYRHHYTQEEMPWRFILSNPLLNSEKYAHKIAEVINTYYNGQYFSKITKYQTLSTDVLKIIVNEISLFNLIPRAVIDFICENIKLIPDTSYKLDHLYKKVIEKRWEDKPKANKIILDMPSKYQIKFFKEVNPTLEFLKKMTIPKEEKKKLLEDLV